MDEALYTYIRTLLLPTSGSKGDPAYREKVYEAFQHVESIENLYKALQSSLNLVCLYYISKTLYACLKMPSYPKHALIILII